ncbi:MAG: hypothetical protein ACJ07L_16290 [Opitutales bacterium]
MKNKAIKIVEWCLPDKPIFNVNDLTDLFGSRTSVWRIQKLGFLRKLPGTNLVQVPRSEVIRYLGSVGGAAE